MLTIGIIASQQSQALTGYPLTDYPMTSGGAWGLKLLKQDYAGSAIRVRRSSDNAEQDIGFSGNDLDTSSLTSFIGANSGFIRTIYDQSGNGNDLVQTTASSQPFIISSGTLQTTNGQPSINFGTISQKLILVTPSGFLTSAANIAYFHVARITYGGNEGYVFYPATGSGLEIYTSNAGSQTRLRFNAAPRNNNAGADYRLWDDATQTLTAINGNSSATSVLRNNTAVTLTSYAAMPSLSASSVYNIGSVATKISDMSLQCLIIYKENKESVMSNICSSINGIWGVY